LELPIVSATSELLNLGYFLKDSASDIFISFD
jgi:hypothetical protein